MSDPKGESSEIMAFLKLSVAVIGEGDCACGGDDVMRRNGSSDTAFAFARHQP